MHLKGPAGPKANSISHSRMADTAPNTRAPPRRRPNADIACRCAKPGPPAQPRQCACASASAKGFVHARTQTRIHACTHILANTRLSTHKHTLHAHMRFLYRMHACAHKHTHTHAHAPSRARTQSRMHSRARAGVQAHVGPCARTHTHTHARACTHARTRRHTGMWREHMPARFPAPHTCEHPPPHSASTPVRPRQLPSTYMRELSCPLPPLPARPHAPARRYARSQRRCKCPTYRRATMFKSLPVAPRVPCLSRRVAST